MHPGAAILFQFSDVYGGRNRSCRCGPESLDALISRCHIAFMNQIKTVCVYCGSGPGTNPRFIEAATAFGKALAENGVGLVYGGGSIGLMGAVAKSTLDHGGTVTGIIPEFLATRERLNTVVTELVVTHDMHERKRLMFERSDAFVALPGGIGTLEELVEQLTWVQLGRHKKPVLIANIGGFWDPLMELIFHMKTLGFIHSERHFNYLVTDNVDDILPKLYADAMASRQVDPSGIAIDRL
jgi:uncharacterized protein (TIGR00730 family)